LNARERQCALNNAGCTQHSVFARAGHPHQPLANRTRFALHKGALVPRPRGHARARISRTGVGGTGGAHDVDRRGRRPGAALGHAPGFPPSGKRPTSRGGRVCEAGRVRVRILGTEGTEGYGHGCAIDTAAPAGKLCETRSTRPCLVQVACRTHTRWPGARAACCRAIMTETQRGPAPSLTRQRPHHPVRPAPKSPESPYSSRT